MRFIIVLFYAVAVECGISPAYQEKIMMKIADIADVCIPEVGASDDDIAELMEFKNPSTIEGKCLLSCFARELGMYKNGRPDRDAVIASMAELKEDSPTVHEQVLEVFKKCAQEVSMDEEDLCELSSKFVICVQKIGTEMGLDRAALIG